MKRFGNAFGHLIVFLIFTVREGGFEQFTGHIVDP